MRVCTPRNGLSPYSTTWTKQLYIDMNATRKIDFVRAIVVNVAQTGASKVFRATVFPWASVLGRKLPPMTAFSCLTNAQVHQEIAGFDGVMVTLQQQEFTDDRLMLEWIDEVR